MPSALGYQYEWDDLTLIRRTGRAFRNFISLLMLVLGGGLILTGLTGTDYLGLVGLAACVFVGVALLAISEGLKQHSSKEIVKDG